MDWSSSSRDDLVDIVGFLAEQIACPETNKFPFKNGFLLYSRFKLLRNWKITKTIGNMKEEITKTIF